MHAHKLLITAEKIKDRLIIRPAFHFDLAGEVVNAITRLLYAFPKRIGC